MKTLICTGVIVLFYSCLVQGAPNSSITPTSVVLGQFAFLPDGSAHIHATLPASQKPWGVLIGDSAMLRPQGPLANLEVTLSIKNTGPEPIQLKSFGRVFTIAFGVTERIYLGNYFNLWQYADLNQYQLVVSPQPHAQTFTLVMFLSPKNFEAPLCIPVTAYESAD